MDYTLHQLVIFLKVVEKGSITKAAQDLHLTQPAVSIQLKKLQDQFDIPLTEVIGRKLYITDFGKEMAIAAQHVLDEIDEIKHKSKAYKGLLAGQLRIAVVSTGKYVMPYFLTDFLHLHPEIQLVMDVTNKAKVIASIEENTIDFGLVSVLPQNLPIHRMELMQNKLFLIRNYTGKVPDQPLKAKALQDFKWIYREKGSATRRVMERFLSRMDIPKEKRMELTSNEAVKQAVIADLGYSIMPLIGIRNELNNKDLEILPTEGPPITTNWNLIWLKEKALSPVAEALLAYLNEHVKDIIHTHFRWYEKFLG